jgi:hypothetical protein
MEGGIKALNATGMDERMITTLRGKPSSMLPNPMRYAREEAKKGTSTNLMIETETHSFK